MLVHFRPHLCSGYTDQYHPPDAPLVVVEVDDGVDAAGAGEQDEADHGGDPGGEPGEQDEADHGGDQQPRHLLLVLLSPLFLSLRL